MTESDRPNERDALRRLAEARARLLHRQPTGDLEEARRWLRDLQEYAAELDLQNSFLRQAQLDLEEVRHGFERLFSDAPVALALLDEEARVLRCNDGMLHLLGHLTPPASLLECVEPPERFASVLRRALEHGERVTETVDLLTAAGERREVTLRCSKASSGAEPRVLCAIVDETERVRTQSRLQESEERYRQLLELMPESLLVVQDGKVLYANRCAAEKLGVASPTDAIGMDLSRHVQSLHPWSAGWLAASEGSRTDKTQFVQVEVTPLQGPPFIAEVMGARVRQAGSEAWLVVLHDVSERLETEERLRIFESAFRHAQEAIGIYDLGTLTSDGASCLHANQAAVELTGYTAEELLALDPRQLLNERFSEEDRRELLASVLAGTPTAFEIQLVRKDGTTRWLASTVSPLRNDAGEMTHVVGLSRDITVRLQDADFERERARALRCVADDAPLDGVFAALCDMLNARFPAGGFAMAWEEDDEPLRVHTADGVPEGFRTWLCGRIEDGALRTVPRYAPQLSNSDGLGELGNLELGAPDADDGRPASEPFRCVAFGSLGAGVRGLLGYRVGSGLQVDSRLRASLEAAAQIASLAVDRRQMRRQLSWRARYDSLTELLNRHAFEEALQKTVADASLRKEQLAVLFIDLDRFKAINDNLGHAIGDMLLVEAAERLRRCTRKVDVLARTGGDEFVLITSPVKQKRDVDRLCQRIASAFSRPFVLEGRDLYVSVSIGIALFPEHGMDADTLLRQADAAMYRAKSRGRAGHAWPEENALIEGLSNLDLESRLQQALDRDEIKLHYQPQVRLTDGRIVGAEALARWTTSDGEFIPPGRFIPVAEESGVIVRLGRKVLEHACRDMSEALAKRDAIGHVAVNVSPHQLVRDEFVGIVEGILDTYGVEKGRIELEVTESALMQDIDQAAQRLQALRELGVILAIDDFGTGYSSFMVLNRLPVDRLKIDRYFVMHILDEDGATNTRAVVEAIIAMAKHLGLRTIAEGVETLEEAEALIAMGCDEAQGYYFARPMPLEKLLELPDILPIGR